MYACGADNQPDGGVDPRDPSFVTEPGTSGGADDVERLRAGWRRAAVVSVAGLSLVGIGAGMGVAAGGVGASADNRAAYGWARQPRLENVVYLSHVNRPGMPVFPGDPIPTFEQTFNVDDDGFALQTVRIGDHTGTHYGAPCHFNAEEICAEDLPASSLVRPAAVIDVRTKVAANPDYAMSLQDVRDFERRYGRIPNGALVIAFTGWDTRWDDPAAYFNADEDGVMHYPGIAVEAVDWLIANRAIGGLGIDTHGIDPGADTTYASNAALLGGERIHLENLTGLEQLPATGAWLVVGGVRNLGGSGSPATVLGILPRMNKAPALMAVNG